MISRLLPVVPVVPGAVEASLAMSFLGLALEIAQESGNAPHFVRKHLDFGQNLISELQEKLKDGYVRNLRCSNNKELYLQYQKTCKNMENLIIECKRKKNQNLVFLCVGISNQLNNLRNPTNIKPLEDELSRLQSLIGLVDSYVKGELGQHRRKALAEKEDEKMVKDACSDFKEKHKLFNVVIRVCWEKVMSTVRSEVLEELLNKMPKPIRKRFDRISSAVDGCYGHDKKKVKTESRSPSSPIQPRPPNVSPRTASNIKKATTLKLAAAGKSGLGQPVIEGGKEMARNGFVGMSRGLVGNSRENDDIRSIVCG